MDRKALQNATIEELQKAYDTGMLPTDITQEEFNAAWKAAHDRQSEKAKQDLIDARLFY